MSRDARKWEKIKAEYCSGRKPSDIARRHKVSIADIVRRARADGWTQSPPKTKKKTTKKKAAALPVPAAQAAEPPPKEEDERASALKGHRSMMSTLRNVFDRELAELQEMLGHTASFLDAAKIDELRAQAAVSGDTSELLKYFLNAVKVRKLTAEMLEKLARTATQIVTSERTALGIKDTDGGQQEATWDDLLALVEQPTSPHELPANVVEFERRALGR